MNLDPARLVGAIEVAAGVATVVAARRVARSPLAGLPRGAMVGVVRFLGVRQVAQGLVTLARPERRVLRGGAGVDALHALSLVPVVALPGPYRRQAAWSAGLAVAGGAAALAAASRTRP